MTSGQTERPASAADALPEELSGAAQSSPSPEAEALDGLLQAADAILAQTAESESLREAGSESLQEAKTEVLQTPAQPRRPGGKGRGRFERTAPVSADAPQTAGSSTDESEDDEDDEPPVKRHPILRGIGCALLYLVLLFSLAVLAFDLWVVGYLKERGREQMLGTHDNVVIAVPENDEKRVYVHDDGKTLQYNGHTYRLNENIATVLFMGVDRESLDQTDVYGTGGQADCILLLAIDVQTGEVKIVSISRDTYAEMVLYSGGGQELGFDRRQLCLAYAYGDGREISCENMLATVSRLLYGMPISKYIALDMDGVLAANEAVGGVTVACIGDFQLANGTTVRDGQEVTLHGKNLARYIRRRSDDVDANAARMERQKQYVLAFSNVLRERARTDFGVISTLYSELSPYMVSNLDLSDVIFLAQIYLDSGLSIDFSSISGTYDLLELEGTHSVFYPDEDSLFQTVLDIYYVQIDD